MNERGSNLLLVVSFYNKATSSSPLDPVNSLGGSSQHSFQSDQVSFPPYAIGAAFTSAFLVDYLVDPFDRETDASQIRMSFMDFESGIEQWRDRCLVQARKADLRPPYIKKKGFSASTLTKQLHEPLFE